MAKIPVDVVDALVGRFVVVGSVAVVNAVVLRFVLAENVGIVEASVFADPETSCQ